MAPIGGKPFQLPGGRIACEEGVDLRGWSVSPDGRSIRPPAGGTEAAIARLPVAADRAACPTGAAVVSLVPAAHLPMVDASSVVVDLDGGRAWFEGRGLRGAVVLWTGAGSGQALAGVDVCSEVSAAAAHAERCAIAVARGLSADPSTLALTVLPSGVGNATDVTVRDDTGREVGRNEMTFRPRRILLARLMAADATVQFEAGTAHLSLVHPESVASVDCADATCTLEGATIAVRGEHGADSRLDLRLHLRPHVFLQTGAATTAEADPPASLPIVRCPAAIVSAPPFRGVASQRIVLRVGGACARDPALQYMSEGRLLSVESTARADGDSLAVVRIGAVEGDELRLSVQRAGTIEAEAHTATVELPLARARLELPGLGPIEFIPTNRPALVRVPAGNGRATWLPVPVPGAYDVTTANDGSFFVRGIEGAAGSVALRLATRDPALPLSLRGTDLATYSEPVEHALRTANVPVPLVGGVAGDLVELACGDGEGHPIGVEPGRTTSIPYRARSTCRLRLHGERVRPEDGTQRLHLGGEVVTADGERRAEGRLDKTVALPPGSRVREIAADGVLAPFDRIVMRANSSPGPDPTAASADGADVGDALQWSVIAGKDRARIYATTTIPTGLFRVADRAHSGILTLNAGGLFRFVTLSREGTESPVGIEAGAMWLGIPGDGTAAASSRGQVAAVVGLGVGIPIANRSRASQTSISVHAWLEYELSRAFLREPGSAVGFVFGPSLSMGDVGANF